MSKTGVERGGVLHKHLLIIVALGLPTAAYAGPKPYPYKAGVTAEALEAEQGECISAATAAYKNPAAPTPYNPVTQGAAAGAAGAAFASGFARGVEQGRAYKITYLNCMKSKEYIHLGLPSAEWKQIRKMPEADRRARLLALSSSATPQHEMVPEDEMD